VLLADASADERIRAFAEAVVATGLPVPPVVRIGAEDLRRADQFRSLAQDRELVIIECPPLPLEVQRAALMVADLAIRGAFSDSTVYRRAGVPNDEKQERQGASQPTKTAPIKSMPPQVKPPAKKAGGAARQLRRVRLTMDGRDFVLRVTDGIHEYIERFPANSDDRRLDARIKELGLSESMKQLLNGDELAVP